MGCGIQTPGDGKFAALPPFQVRNGLSKLPVFKPVALKMLQLLALERAEVRGIAHLLRTDPALSAEVLAVANSAFYGNKHHIDSLSRAILVLGFERTRAVTITLALRSFIRNPANPAVMQSCWKHSVASAILAEELAPLYDIPKDRGYTGALIHDVGRLGLLRSYGDHYAPVFATGHETVADCLESERELFDMDHCQAGLLLTQRWGFPSEYSRVAGCHHGEAPSARQDLVALVHDACLLADALGFNSIKVAQLPEVPAILAQMPANPWNSYKFDQALLQDRIAGSIASLELK